MARTVKCAFCGLQVEKDKCVRLKDKNYHPDCAEKFKEKNELLNYICYIFGLKRPGPVVYSQLKNFIESNSHYTYTGILNSLKYFYEVKRNSIKKSNNAIGIVPYVYDEAQKYYSKIDYKKKRIEENVTKTLDNEVEKRYINTQKRSRKDLIDIEKIFYED